MRTALISGVDKGVPIQITACVLAEAWHVPPWEIYEHPGSLRWEAWYSFYHEQLVWVRDYLSKT